MLKSEIDIAIKFLGKDKHLKQVIKKFPKPNFDANDAYFQNEKSCFKVLARYIIHQQISGKVAKVIEDRFFNLFGKHILPKKFLTFSTAKLKSAGLSSQKISYITDLANKFLDKTIDSKAFTRMNDEDIKTHLIKVKGIGPWTADMFLIFTLHRKDILPLGDLGIQKGFKSVFKMKKLPNPKKMERLAKKWQPYRTVASMYLWKVADQEKQY